MARILGILGEKSAERTPQNPAEPIKERAGLYAILCYNSEDIVYSWPKEQDDAVMARLSAVQQKLASAGRLGPVARLMPTTTATTLRKDREPALVIDGPFAETKEQLLGFYIVDCEGLEQALETARELGNANPGGAYEIRPVAVLNPAAPGFASESGNR